MGFFKEVDRAIGESAPDLRTCKAWLELANQHFKGAMSIEELPYELQQVLRAVEQIYTEACEHINKAEESEVAK